MIDTGIIWEEILRRMGEGIFYWIYGGFIKNL